MKSSFTFYPDHFLKSSNPGEGLVYEKYKGNTITESTGRQSYKVFEDYAVVVRFHGKQSLVSIPATFDGMPVTAIGSHTFSGCKSIVAVIIPDSVTRIGFAFIGCTNLSKIHIPDSVLAINSYAFEGCTSLKEVTISKNTIISDTSFDPETKVIRR